MIKIFPNFDELNFFAAEKIVEIANNAVESNGRFTIALAGGSTPKSLYQLLASDKFKNQIDWTKVFFFFGDERNVSPDDNESNFRMANENLFVPLKIADENIFRWKTEIKDAEIIGLNYELTIRKFFEDKEDKDDLLMATNGLDLPRFDSILLGLGEDGHTASLFPFTKALNEMEKITVANIVEKLNTTRLTLTFPVINNARNVIFLIAGEGKAEALKEVLEGIYQPEKYPAQAVKLNDGDLYWLIDGRAAQLLN